jgi:hypothetical protein
LIVQRSPSSHIVPSAFFGLEQVPVFGLHVPTSWHWGSEAVQTTGSLPTQLPPALHLSVCVHALPSSQSAPVLGGFEHCPFEGLHVPATWHWSDAVHVTALPPTQLPPMHLSACVHMSLSLHAVPSCTFWFEHCPVAWLQTPAVLHWVAAPQDTGFMPVQVPLTQLSVCVQASLSLHAVPVRGACTQPVDGLQLSIVHGLLSSHEIDARTHTPPVQVPSETWHMSLAVQALPSSFWQAPVALHALHAPQPMLLQQKPSVQNRPAAH